MAASLPAGLLTSAGETGLSFSRLETAAHSPEQAAVPLSTAKRA
jgi:hypothetical protein